MWVWVGLVACVLGLDDHDLSVLAVLVRVCQSCSKSRHFESSSLCAGTEPSADERSNIECFSVTKSNYSLLV